MKTIEKLKAPRLDGLVNRFLVIYSKPLAGRIPALVNIYWDLCHFLARFKRARSIVIPRVGTTLKEKVYA